MTDIAAQPLRALPGPMVPMGPVGSGLPGPDPAVLSEAIGFAAFLLPETDNKAPSLLPFVRAAAPPALAPNPESDPAPVPEEQSLRSGNPDRIATFHPLPTPLGDEVPTIALPEPTSSPGSTMDRLLTMKPGAGPDNTDEADPMGQMPAFAPLANIAPPPMRAGAEAPPPQMPIPFPVAPSAPAAPAQAPLEQADPETKTGRATVLRGAAALDRPGGPAFVPTGPDQFADVTAPRPDLSRTNAPAVPDGPKPGGARHEGLARAAPPPLPAPAALATQIPTLFSGPDRHSLANGAENILPARALARPAPPTPILQDSPAQHPAKAGAAPKSADPPVIANSASPAIPAMDGGTKEGADRTSATAPVFPGPPKSTAFPSAATGSTLPVDAPPPRRAPLRETLGSPMAQLPVISLRRSGDAPLPVAPGFPHPAANSPKPGPAPPAALATPAEGGQVAASPPAPSAITLTALPPPAPPAEDGPHSTAAAPPALTPTAPNPARPGPNWTDGTETTPPRMAGPLPGVAEALSALPSQADGPTLGPFSEAGPKAPMPGVAPQTVPQPLQMPVPVTEIAAVIGRIGQTGPEITEISLSPEELGRLRLQLIPDGDRIQVILSAERPETLDLLRRNIEQLAADLRQMGFSSSAFGFAGWAGEQDRGRSTPALPPEAGQDAPLSPPVMQARGGTVARHGVETALDLRL